MNDKADLLVLGNVITMDEHKLFAEAVAVKGEKILYVGSAEVAKKLCDGHTKIYDYGNSSVYPGFLEAHCHPGGAGYLRTGLAHLNSEASLEECVKVMKEYMEAHPEKSYLSGMGFTAPDAEPDAAMLDAICPDKIMVCTDSGGHSMWMNTKAMEKYGINREAVEKWGTDCVRVDENGNPTGYISEGPVFHVRAMTEITVADMKDAVMAWEKFALSKGYTGAYNAGVEVTNKHEKEAYYELEKEGKLKLHTYAGSMVMDNTDTPEEDMARIAKDAEEHNSKHYRLIGAKVFCDGVVEAHTAWLLDDYADQPGYKGVSRFDDHDKMVRLLKAASEHNMNVHIHSIGDRSTKAWVDAIAEAEEATGNFDMRNALAHLQYVSKEDLKRFGDYNIIAVAAVMWVRKYPGFFEQEVEYVGEERANHAYPIKAFLDNGAVMVSHSDYPVSSEFSVPHVVCLGVSGTLPSSGKDMIRQIDQCISRKDTLKALTINVAYSWHAEDIMGSLEIGKLANIAVFDKDFMNDDLEEIEKAKCLATFVDGEPVYMAQ
ncbi:MAG: amidohydrolase [Lachnospiraceae bacterium]|nr:amidohydrolase [Lachnospiraceae bacterium]